jgi:hypothetical protein
VDRVGREVGDGVHQEKRGPPDVLGRYLVGEVHQSDVRRDGEDDPLHHADVLVFGAKIG